MGEKEGIAMCPILCTLNELFYYWNYGYASVHVKAVRGILNFAKEKIIEEQNLEVICRDFETSVCNQFQKGSAKTAWSE